MANKDVDLTLQEAVAEVLNLLTGLDLTYIPEQDRFQSITRSLNRALRQVALESDWSVYASTEDIGTVVEGTIEMDLPSSLRPRITTDDAVRLVTDEGFPRKWAYFLPRDALHKYASRPGLWVAVTRTTLTFSRPFWESEEGLHVTVPCMREPRMFRLPPDNATVPARILNQVIDFDFPDLVVARAAYLYAQSDPVMQPRVPTLEAIYKDLMYQLVERDTNFTDSPYSNEFFVPILGSLSGGYHQSAWEHTHPHSDERAV